MQQPNWIADTLNLNLHLNLNQLREYLINHTLDGSLNTTKILTRSDWLVTYQEFQLRNQLTQPVNSMADVIRFYTNTLDQVLFNKANQILFWYR